MTAFCEQIKQHWKVILTRLVISLVVIAFLLICIAGYAFRWSWTGLTPFIGPQVQQYQPGKTLWDWMQLLVVPAALTFFVYWYNRKDQRATEQRAQIERERLLDAQRQATLQAYIDRMSDVLLSKSVDELKKDPKFFIVTRARTLATLASLDPHRKTMVFDFLYTAGLIVLHLLDEADLQGARLRGANLREMTFIRANLSGADLRGVVLTNANLSDANLRGANLERASLIETQLTGADLTDANLKDTHLSKADFRKAIYTKEQLAQATERDDMRL